MNDVRKVLITGAGSAIARAIAGTACTRRRRAPHHQPGFVHTKLTWGKPGMFAVASPKETC